MTHDGINTLAGASSERSPRNAQNYLTQVDGSPGYCSTLTGTAATACYGYDANGHRVHRTGVLTDTCDNTGKRDYAYDLSGHWVLEVNSNGTACQGQLFVGGRLLGAWGGEFRYDHTDWLGTLRLQNSVSYPNYHFKTCTSLPFGDALHCTWYNDTLHFTGKERDPESGLDNFGARYNSSSMGRFMSPDPNNAGEIDENPQSWNGYAYALNNPLRYTDPDGTNVLVCIDGQDKCHNYTDDQYARLLKEQNGQQGINLPNQALPNGNITCGGVKCGTATYFEPGMESANGMNFAIGGLFKFAIEGGISLLEGLFGSGARTAGQAAAGATTNAVSGPAQQIVANGTKQAVRDALENSGLSDAAKATIKGALRRGAAGDSYTVEKLADGSVTITREVAGQAGGRAAYEQVIDGATGATKSVVQKAYDASGNLVHVDPKFP